MPRTLPIDNWADSLQCTDSEREQLRELALLAQAPEATNNGSRQADRQRPGSWSSNQQRSRRLLDCL